MHCRVYFLSKKSVRNSLPIQHKLLTEVCVPYKKGKMRSIVHIVLPNSTVQTAACVYIISQLYKLCQVSNSFEQNNVLCGGLPFP